ncbi:F0F1 ATP synthase subunit A [Planctomycetota bacterium]|nr:F0F1 ATP synthase subunit A [Planctomycetota bacterium]
MLILGDWIVEHLLDIQAIPGLGNLGVSKHVIAMWAVALLLVLTFLPMGRFYAKGDPVPRGILVNLLESICLFLRDEVARPFLGKAGDKYLPVLWTFFFFILYCNLLGLLPNPIPTPTMHHGQVVWHEFGLVTATGQIEVTGTLAFMAFFWWHGLGIREQGLIPYIKNIVPSGLPLPLIPILFVIEIFGHFIKALALMIRLWANMMGGHTVLYVVMGMTFIFGYVMAPASVVLGVAVYFLEIFVAFLQAYVFTFLVTVFLGGALHPDH